MRKRSVHGLLALMVGRRVSRRASGPGLELRRLRELRGLSMRELARRANLSHVAVSNLEGGAADPEPDTLMKLEDVLDLRGELFKAFKKHRDEALQQHRDRQIVALHDSLTTHCGHLKKTAASWGIAPLRLFGLIQQHQISILGYSPIARDIFLHYAPLVRAWLESNGSAIELNVVFLRALRGQGQVQRKNPARRNIAASINDSIPQQQEMWVASGEERKTFFPVLAEVTGLNAALRAEGSSDEPRPRLPHG